jgi:hypothetical protein
MIAYVQDQSFPYWLDQLNCWIRDLAVGPSSVWSDSDMLQLLSDNSASEVRTIKSVHLRAGGLGECELHHLWVRVR